MVLRFLMQYLGREHIVNKLADSRPVRRAARFVVYLMNRSSINGIPTNSQELSKQWTSLLTRFGAKLKQGITEAGEELKKRQPK